MNFKEIVIIEDILKTLKPVKSLEWGSGYSTLYFPKFLYRGSWLSIEHEKSWFAHVKSCNNNKNVSIFFVPPNNFPWTDENSDGSYSDLQDYINYPKHFGNFDFILIDGRARVDCIVQAYNLVNDAGVVILHDANRQYYHKGFKFFKNNLLFEDHRRNSGGLWLGSKKRDLNTFIDTFDYISFWKLCTSIEHKLKLSSFEKLFIQTVLKK